MNLIICSYFIIDHVKSILFWNCEATDLEFIFDQSGCDLCTCYVRGSGTPFMCPKYKEVAAFKKLLQMQDWKQTLIIHQGIYCVHKYALLKLIFAMQYHFTAILNNHLCSSSI